MARKNLKKFDGHVLNADADPLDFRDYTYQPALVSLKEYRNYPDNLKILDQGKEGACTGFGLAAVINLQLSSRGEPSGNNRMVSARMLYEMAKKFDEWEEGDYAGSSCRGAIKGWYNMGVCEEKLAKYSEGEQNWTLTIKQAKDARKTTLGAYYRLSKRISDFHAALNEVEVIYASAKVHEGWKKSKVKKNKGLIKYDGNAGLGGHAFAIVGYNSNGFWIQNSWGSDWGDNGVALWSYEDWLENIQDAWVIRLALSTPQISHLTPSVDSTKQLEQGFKRSPKRAEIVGHFVHIDDGDFDHHGNKYWTDLPTVQQTARLVATSENYGHLLLYAHGGLNSINASARRIFAMKEVFKNNGIYPFHFMYDTGLFEEIKDVLFGKEKELDKRTRGFFTDFTDKLIEKLTRPVGRAIWREMKNGAKKPFTKTGAGTQTISAFMKAFAQPGAIPKKVHLVGHSTGAILLAALLEALKKLNPEFRVTTTSLLAPACTHDDFEKHFLLWLNQHAFGIDHLTIYNLSKNLERDDKVTPLYRKSLLYLVSNAFEEVPGEKILGLQKYAEDLPKSPKLNIIISKGRGGTSSKSASKTHGGFDNDKRTMNSVLKSILGEKPEHPFTDSNLQY